MIADAHQRWTLRVVCVSTALLLLNVAAPQVALSAIAQSLDASFADLQWVLSGYALALAVFLLTAGNVSPTASGGGGCSWPGWRCSAPPRPCAPSPTAGRPIAARLFEGLGAAVVFPASLAILAEAFQGPARRRAIGAWGATIGLAFAAGPLIGGLLVGTASAGAPCSRPTSCSGCRRWRSRSATSPSRATPTRRRSTGRASARSASGCSRASSPCCAATSSAGAAGAVLGCLALCAVALAAFVAVEHATPRPMLDLGLFRNRTFAGATLIVALLAAGTFGAFVYVTSVLLDVQGRNPVEAGLVLAPLALVSFVVSAAAGRNSERVPLRGALVAGMRRSGSCSRARPCRPAPRWPSAASPHWPTRGSIGCGGCSSTNRAGTPTCTAACSCRPTTTAPTWGSLFWHKDGFSTACGHGTIALGAWAVRTGRVRRPRTATPTWCRRPVRPGDGTGPLCRGPGSAAWRSAMSGQAVVGVGWPPRASGATSADGGALYASVGPRRSGFGSIAGALSAADRHRPGGQVALYAPGGAASA